MSYQKAIINASLTMYGCVRENASKLCSASGLLAMINKGNMKQENQAWILTQKVLLPVNKFTVHLEGQLLLILPKGQNSSQQSRRQKMP